tara:strand:+ start:7743 stop:7862 length:120 start_codon:yes stop_codon:yes gene_type:complete
MINWKEIWSKEERINSIILDCLVKANGFDTASGKLDVAD